MGKSDSLDWIIGDDIENINPAAVYYFTKGFIKECENLRVCEIGEIRIKKVLRYLGYGKELIMLFENNRSLIKKMLKYMNINYKRYENSGREFAEKYFRYNYVKEIYDIGPERVAELIDRCMYSKSYYFLFRENTPNNKRKSVFLHY
ncbi:MAG: hypothetical protein RXO36_05450 [Candidatus Nanopusillus acidilobi]